MKHWLIFTKAKKERQLSWRNLLKIPNTGFLFIPKTI